MPLLLRMGVVDFFGLAFTGSCCRPSYDCVFEYSIGALIFGSFCLDIQTSQRGSTTGISNLLYLLPAVLASCVLQVILDCADYNVDFYEKSGFIRKEIQMVKYF